MSKFKEVIETQITNKVIEGEYELSKINKTKEVNDFDSYVDLLDMKREPKEYDWMSDVRMPEFVSHVLTQSSLDVNQYFQQRDFVEAYVEDAGDEALAGAAAAKECINRTLNRRDLYHYLKYTRGRIINQLSGRVYAKCHWEQKTIDKIVGKQTVPTEVGKNLFGDAVFEDIEEPITQKEAIIDNFNYDILDPRNVFMDNKYVYSLQQKDWISIRDEKSLSELIADQEEMGYFNLDVLSGDTPEDSKEDPETETSEETYNKPHGTFVADTKEDGGEVNRFDIIERFGKFWCVVKTRSEDGYPEEVEPGYDENGVRLEKAELVETIITHAISSSVKVLIRFQATPYIDYRGLPYKPIIRGLCYVHPTQDGGMGDGKHSKELQLAIDDTVNVSNDRVILATTPVFKVKRYEAEDNPDIYVAPGHAIPLDNPKDDLMELNIQDDIQGAMIQTDVFRKMMQQLNSIWPTTMGDTPGLASTTATAVAGAETQTGLRSNYKSLTFENTFLTELYYMILQMTWSFAQPETGVKLMGDKVFDFDPSKDYFYKPVSSAIENEYSKVSKIKQWQQILQTVVGVQHPDAVNMVNHIMSQIYTLMGDEFANFSNAFLNPEQPIENGSGQGTPEEGGQPTSNQAGLPQSGQEQLTREVIGG